MTRPRLLPAIDGDLAPETLEGQLVIRAASRYHSELAACRTKADRRVTDERLAAFAEVGADLLGLAQTGWGLAMVIKEALGELPPTRGDEDHRLRWQTEFCEVVQRRLAD